MLGYIEIILILKEKEIIFLYQSNERPAKKKLLPAKLRAVLANFGFVQFF